MLNRCTCTFQCHCFVLILNFVYFIQSIDVCCENLFLYIFIQRKIKYKFALAWPYCYVTWMHVISSPGLVLLSCQAHKRDKFNFPSSTIFCYIDWSVKAKFYMEPPWVGLNDRWIEKSGSPGHWLCP